MTDRVALYSAVDNQLTRYEVDLDAATLTRKESIQLDAKLQYAWPHPSGSHLYVSTSTGGPRVAASDSFLGSLAIAANGQLSRHGSPARLSRRAVHLCIDPSGRFALNAHNFPTSGLTVHRIDADGAIGEQVAQDAPLNAGIYPHQVRVFPSAGKVLIVDRGNKAAGGRPEEPGALRTFGFTDGECSPDQVVAPHGGHGFGARHVDFHPTLPCLYVADERTNRLYMFRCDGGIIESAPSFTLDTLAEPGNVRPRQIAGPIHVHPGGQCVYVANRADQTTALGDAQVFSGGENNIAVYALDPVTGEPRLAQHADTRSIHVRTFACDPSGRLLVAASIKALDVLDNGKVDSVPAALSVFRIGSEGELTFVRKYDVPTTGAQLQYWMGMVRLA